MQQEQSLAPGQFIDPTAEGVKSLYRTEAFSRSGYITDVFYQIAYGLQRGGETFQGKSKITFTISAQSLGDMEKNGHQDIVFVDYRGDKVFSLVINGTVVLQEEGKPSPFRDHRIYFDRKHLNAGENTAVIRYQSKYCRDCEGVQFFEDKDDKEEYIYSNHEPASAHKGFPCFDQPDMKATYTFMAIAPRDWNVVANAPQVGSKSYEGSEAFKGKLQSFGLDSEEFLSYFKGEQTCVFEFAESPKISTYLYCFMAGPYQCFESDVEEIRNFKVPLRLFCRKSVAKYLENVKEDYFNTTKSGIEYYEKLFTCNYPFAKLDQVFCPDFSAGAMENVGLITYRDQFIQRDEFFTEQKKQYTRMVILHEISHMWFGNMVTMKWWDDLWLNESFANFVSYMSLDEGEGTKQYEGAWSMFLDESFWGLTTDQKNTTHPISVEVIHTEAAFDMFDGISYGKGAAWLNQILNLFGRDIFKEGVKTYFAEFAYKNTKLSDFIFHFNNASKKFQSPIDFEKWSNTWLKCAGPNIIWHDIEEQGGKITKFTVQQRVHENGEGNQLRVQKYKCAFYDQNMNVAKVIDIVTKDDQETFEIAELVGQDAPFAYHINYQNKGYAKFKIDQKSTKAFETNLGQIQDPLSRKQIYLIYNDMLKDQNISGAQVLDICKSQLQQESEVGVLSAVVQRILPMILNTYLPQSMYLKTNHDLFELILDNILSGNSTLDQTTKTLLFDSMMSSCVNEDHQKKMIDWFKQGKVINSAGAPLDHIELTLKNKHALVKKIWCSKEIPIEIKQSILSELNTLDKGDWFDETSKFVDAANPENKGKMWALYFSSDKDSEIEKWGLYNYQHSFSGWSQKSHKELTEPYEDEFFTKIGEIIKTKGRSVAEAYYHGLQPMNKTDDAAIKKFEDLLAKVETEDKDNTFFINALKDSITVLKIKQKGAKVSQDYLDSKN